MPIILLFQLTLTLRYKYLKQMTQFIEWVPNLYNLYVNEGMQMNLVEYVSQTIVENKTWGW